MLAVKIIPNIDCDNAVDLFHCSGRATAHMVPAMSKQTGFSGARDHALQSCLLPCPIHISYP